ncbi:MAG: hypothetical protein HWD59_10395 [Coxiellaceae bacterium]|nr:MAG: hypothetical protein HWD59_10395 [Coxiellaceae bacterium]
MEKFDKANLVKHLVAAIEARNFQEIALFREFYALFLRMVQQKKWNIWHVNSKNKW